MSDEDENNLAKKNRLLVLENERLREEASKDRNALTDQVLKLRNEVSVAQAENNLWVEELVWEVSTVVTFYELESEIDDFAVSVAIFWSKKRL